MESLFKNLCNSSLTPLLRNRNPFPTPIDASTVGLLFEFRWQHIYVCDRHCLVHLQNWSYSPLWIMSTELCLCVDLYFEDGGDMFLETLIPPTRLLGVISKKFALCFGHRFSLILQMFHLCCLWLLTSRFVYVDFLSFCLHCHHPLCSSACFKNCTSLSFLSCR